MTANTPRGYDGGENMKEQKSKLIRRLKIIEGQVRGLQRMVKDDIYCVHIITQSLAVKRALSGVEDAVLEKHLATHAVDQMRSGRRKKAVGEIMRLYKLSKRK